MVSKERDSAVRTIVLRKEDERTVPDPGAGAERCLTLVFPASVTEYEQARAEVERSAPLSDEKRPGRYADERTTPTPADKSGTAGTSEGGRYVVTTDEQRRAWSLPNLENGTAAPDAAPGDRDTREIPAPSRWWTPARRSSCSSRTARPGPATRPW